MFQVHYKIHFHFCQRISGFSEKVNIKNITWMSLKRQNIIQYKFDTKYDKITIAANGPYEFTPDSYDAENKTCAYNLSLQFKNIKK